MKIAIGPQPIALCVKAHPLGGLLLGTYPNVSDGRFGIASALMYAHAAPNNSALWTTLSAMGGLILGVRGGFVLECDFFQNRQPEAAHSWDRHGIVQFPRAVLYRRAMNHRSCSGSRQTVSKKRSKLKHFRWCVWVAPGGLVIDQTGIFCVSWDRHGIGLPWYDRGAVL